VASAEESAELELEVDAIAGVLVVVVRGDVVGPSLAKLRDCLRRAATRRRPVVVDLAGATSFDDQGAQVLAEAHRDLGRGLRVVAASGSNVHLSVTDAGIAHVLALHASQATALAAAAA
jgi:anti-anti-sigma regulatory factor